MSDTMKRALMDVTAAFFEGYEASFIKLSGLKPNWYSSLWNAHLRPIMQALECELMRTECEHIDEVTSAYFHKMGCVEARKDYERSFTKENK
ncbi:MAG: hypothetical protein ACOX8U_06525 [Bradymonadia bacterium]|jgi:hypothetical protein